MPIQPSVRIAHPIRIFKRGELIHLANAKGTLWRIITGTVRLDLHETGGTAFASLALPGDMLGIESLVFGHYGFTARALTPCTLAPHDAADMPLAQMALAAQRATQVVALRAGSAAQRIQRLAALLTNHGAQPLANKRHLLPRLADIAEITGLTVETVSRTTAMLGSASGLPHKKYRQKSVTGGCAQTFDQPLAA